MEVIIMSAIRSFLVVLSLLFAVAVNAAPVNVNSADAATIASSLNGIGHKKAEAIVAYREANGPFRSVDDLVNVKGIGYKTLQHNRMDILLEDRASKP
jgi:competence protein ComEA